MLTELPTGRPAPYASRFRDQLRLWEPPRTVVQQLALLSAVRQRLINVYNQLAGPLAEQQGFIDAKLQKQLPKTCRASLVALEKDRKAIDQAMNVLIEADPELNQLFELVTSVPGIGKTTATEIVIATNEMKTISDRAADRPKKMACHAGVTPFNYQSGSSIRRRSGVSQHARKRLKSLFHLGAMAAIRAKGEIQDYYQRKVKEGKIGSPKRQNACFECCTQQSDGRRRLFIVYTLWSSEVKNMIKIIL